MNIRSTSCRILKRQGGIAFFLISFTARDEFYYLRFEKLLEFWERAREGGRKSFRYEELEEDFFSAEGTDAF